MAEHRRSADDQEWQQTKIDVHMRDKDQCRFCNCLSIPELKYSRKALHIYESEPHCDCAHYHPVSTHPELVYCRENVYCLCRSHHRAIDNFVDPLTGGPMDKNKQDYYWYRIMLKKCLRYDPNENYAVLIEDLQNFDSLIQ